MGLSQGQIQFSDREPPYKLFSCLQPSRETTCSKYTLTTTTYPATPSILAFLATSHARTHTYMPNTSPYPIPRVTAFPTRRASLEMIRLHDEFRSAQSWANIRQHGATQVNSALTRNHARAYRASKGRARQCSSKISWQASHLVPSQQTPPAPL